jgi:FkbM family methyltransferase
MKELIKNLIGRFGYKLHRKDSGGLRLDPFVVKKELILNKKPVILDVGAHIGSTAKQYRQVFPDALIYCFEPFPQSFNQLKTETINDSLTTVYNLALSDKKGKALLNANRSPATNSLLSTDVKGSFYWGEGLLETMDKCEVETTTIDYFCQDHDLPSIEIMKLDVQGAEFSVLSGATKMLLSQSISIVYTELILASTYQGQKKLHEYMGLLDSFGYELLDIYNPIKKHRQLIQIDSIFVSAKFKQSYERAAS